MPKNLHTVGSGHELVVRVFSYHDRTIKVLCFGDNKGIVFGFPEGPYLTDDLSERWLREGRRERPFPNLNILMEEEDA